MTTIYRLADADADTSSPQGGHSATRRPPGNVPYLVDNLWEWRRPKGFPNRRHAVFASPTPELAAAGGGASNGKVYRVEIRGTCVVAQVQQKDSRYHPDCKDLRKLVLKKLGQPWVDSDLSHKLDAGRLWMPCLSRDEVEALFREGQLAAFREEVCQAVRYWDDARLVDAGALLPFEDGEVFFEAKEWYLRER